MSGFTTWARLCAMSVELCNGIEDHEYRGNLAYMATDSLGGRQAIPRKPVHEVGPSFDGVWEGYAEEDTTLLEWTSGTSGAILRAEKDGDDWVLTFRGEKSFYLRNFARAVAVATVAPPEEVPEWASEVIGRSDLGPEICELADRLDVERYSDSYRATRW